LASPIDLEGGPLVTALGLATFDLPRDKPLFTFLHYFDAHAPYAPPPPFARMYYEGDERAPGVPVLDFLRSSANAAPNRDGGMYDWLAGVTDLRFPAREYAAGVSYTDDHVGQIVAELKRRQRYDDTLIIVVADHGEHLGEHGLWFTHTLPYQETLHVPLLVKLPLCRAAGRLIDTPVSTLDLLPTLLDWLDLPAAEWRRAEPAGPRRGTRPGRRLAARGRAGVGAGRLLQVAHRLAVEADLLPLSRR
jgi:arylsulfatase